MVTVIFLIGIVGFASWKILGSVGRQSLYGRSASGGPDLTGLQQAAGENAGDSETSDANTAADGSEMEDTGLSHWEEGWIRYKGEVYAYNEDILTFLILGIDKSGPATPGKDGISGGQADAQFLAILNPHQKSISILAINRNTMTDVDVYDREGQYVKTMPLQICLQHGYGDGMEQSCERSVKAVSNLLYSLPIHGYCSLNMGAVPQINHAVGGVTLEILEDIPAASGGAAPAMTAGETRTLSDAEAYQYTRWRSDEFDAASLRLKRQRQYLTEFIRQIKQKLKENPTAAAELYTAITPYMVTDLSLSEVSYLASEAGSYSFDSQRIYTLEGETIVGRSDFEEFYPDEDALYDLMIRLFYEKVEETD